MEVEFELSEKDNGCTGFRGELMLSLGEIGRIQRYLLEKSGNFGFELSPEPTNDSNKRNSKKKVINNNKCLNAQTGLDKRKPRSSRPSYSRELKALLEDGWNILESRSDLKGSNNQSSMNIRGNNEDVQKRLPDWAKRFHRILKIVSQQEIFAPFVSCVNINNFHLYIQGLGLESKFEEEFSELDKIELNDKNSLKIKQDEIDKLFNNTKLYLKYLENCGPIKPISLNSVIKKLENNEYSSSASVFSDIYSIWICGFRSQKPGGLLWTKTMDASLNFNLKLLNEPLQDDFSLTFPGSKGNKSNRTIDTSISEPPKKLQNTGKSTFLLTEENGKDLNSTISNRSRKTTNQSIQSGNNRTKSGKKTNNSISLSTNKIISESERREFQSLLSQLSQNDHVELFNSFLSTAHWKEVNSGEVELDDQQTPPDVFREMTRWCKAKLNIPILEDANSKDLTSKIKNKKTRQYKYSNNTTLQKKKTQLSAKQFFSSGRAFSSPSSASEDEDDISSCGNLQISQQWASTSSSSESDSEPEITSFYPHFNSK